VTGYDKTIVYHGRHLTENAEPWSLYHNFIPPSVNPVRSARDNLKGGPTYGQHHRRFSRSTQGRPETVSQESGPLSPSVVPVFSVRDIFRSDEIPESRRCSGFRGPIGCGIRDRLQTRIQKGDRVHTGPGRSGPPHVHLRPSGW